MSEPLLSYKSVIFWAWFSPSSLHSFNSCHSALSSPLTHRSSCFGVLWGLSFLQVFLPHTEGSDRLLISAAAHEVDISTSAPSKGFAPPPAASRRFYLEFSPFGVILRVTTPTRLCFCKKSRLLPARDDKFSCKAWCDRQAVGEPSDETTSSPAKVGWRQLLKSCDHPVALSYHTHTHLLIPGGRQTL